MLKAYWLASNTSLHLAHANFIATVMLKSI